MRLSGTKTGSANQYNGLGDQLYDLGGARPTLDLNFASNGSLVDSVTGKTLVTHTRASNATYVDGDGIIKDAVTNLLTYSEEFDNVAWSTASLTITADDATAPDGTETADKWLNTSTTGIISTLVTKAASAITYTASLWVKSSDATSFSLTLDNGGTGDRGRCTFNIATGELVSTTDDGAFTGTSGTITAYPDSWYRLTVTTTTDTGTNLRWRAFSSGSGDIIYIWGAQLEEASTAGEYVKTTSTINSAPRFDHNPTTGESLGLLVEESRTNLITYSEQFDQWLGAGSTVTTNSITAPDGTQTADLLAEDTSTGQHSRYFTISTTGAQTFSVYAKASSSSRLLRLINYNGTDGSLGTSYFNLETGQVLSGSGIITSVGNGWYRCSITYTTTVTSTAYITFSPSVGTYVYTGDGTSGLYLWGAQLEEGSFPTSYIRTEGSTVTRSADVTSIEGNDFGTFNLVEYSEEFDNSYWTKTSASITPNTQRSPDNSLTADTLTFDGSTTALFLTRRVTLTGNTAGRTFTQSVYIKGSAGGEQLRLNLAELGGAAGSANISQIDITATTDWVRYDLTGSVVENDRTLIEWRIRGRNGPAGSVYVWGAQLEQSSTATPYVKSDVTFTSRASTATYYDYNGIIQTAAVDEARNVAFLPDGSGNFVSAGELLLEDAGTNLLPYSEDFNNVAWVKNGTASVATGFEAPDGSLTAFKATYTTLGNGPHIFSDPGLGDLTSGYRRSVWVKVASGTAQAHILGRYDASNSLVTITNQWQRFELTITDGSFLNGFYLIDFRGSTTPDVDFYFWGAQLEQNPYATSYIPTSGSTATRAADVSSSSSNTFGNSFYNQTEGVLFANSQTPAPTSSYDAVATIGSSSIFLIVSLQRNGADSRGFGANATGSTGSGTNSYPVNTFVKQALAAKQNDFAFSTDGSSINADTSTDPLTAAKHMYIGSNAGDSVSLLTSHIKRITYWPTRLSNDTLQTITV